MAKAMFSQPEQRYIFLALLYNVASEICVPFPLSFVMPQLLLSTQKNSPDFHSRHGKVKPEESYIDFTKQPREMPPALAVRRKGVNQVSI